MHRRRFAAPPVTLALLAIFLPTVTAATPAQSDGTVARTFEVADGGTLTVDASFGSIEVTTSDGNQVVARVTREVRDRYDDDRDRILTEHEVELSQNGNDVTVRTETSEDARERWRDDYRSTPLRVHLEISVPRNYSVDLDTAGGHITVGDLRGALRARTSGGHLRFGEIVGDVWGRTSGGHIEVSEVDGDIDVETSGGSIEVDRVSGDARLETSGGNIRIEEVSGVIDASSSAGNITASIVQQPPADSNLSTSAGSVTVNLGAGIGLDIDASTSVGGVSSDFSVDGRVRRNSIDGSINGGGPELRLRTSAGSIRIRERN